MPNKKSFKKIVGIKTTTKKKIIEIPEFMLHKTKKTNYRDENKFLAGDLEHHTMDAKEIFNNTTVKNHFNTFMINIENNNKYLTLPSLEIPKYNNNPIDYLEKNHIQLKPILEENFKNLIYHSCFGKLDSVAKKLVPFYIENQPKNILLAKPQYDKLKKLYTINNKKIDMAMTDLTIQEWGSQYYNTFSDSNLNDEIRNYKGNNDFISRAKFISEHFEKFLKYKINNEEHLIKLKKNKNYIEEISINKIINTASSNYTNIYTLDLLLKNTGTIPSFNELTGLVALIGSVWAYEAKIKNFIIYSDNSFNYNLEFTVYDHFSLDRGDLDINVQSNKYKKKAIEKLKSFSSWYILQFYKKYTGYTPVIVKSVFLYNRSELIK
jgi:hypothetical protein